MSEVKFAIGIPTINQGELLQQKFDRIYSNNYCFTKFFIVDNGNQNLKKRPYTEIMVQDRNLGVAASWNLLCDKIFRDHDFALIGSDDVTIPGDEFSMNDFIEKSHVQFGNSLISPVDSFCIFIISKKTFNLVGRFDENFYPAYFEDNDYIYRARLAGIGHLETAFLSPLDYLNSQSFQKDRSLGSGYMKNQEYYIKKWGGKPRMETFTKPFNQ